MLSDKRNQLNDEMNEEEYKQLEEKNKSCLEQRKKIIDGELENYGDLIEKFDASHTDL